MIRHPMNKLSSVLFAMLLALSLAAAPDASAQDFPSRVISLIVPFPPGGGTDIVGRLIANAMGERLPSRVIVVNKPGAAGVVGSESVLAAPPDGYTLLFTSQSIVTQTFETQGKVSHKNFIFLGMLNTDAYGIAVGQKAKWQTLQEFLADARRRPGEITIGTTGFGSATYMQIPLLEKAAGVKFLPVPYPGSAGFHTAALAGQIDSCGVVVGDAAALLNSGKLRLLGVMSPKRLEAFPNVPSYKEIGIDVDFIFWRGLFVHKNTPPEVVKVLRNAVAAVANSASFKEQMVKGSFIPAALTSEAELQAFIQNEERMIQDVWKDVGTQKK